MKGKIAVEEHFAIEETLDNPRGIFSDASWAELKVRLVDRDGRMLREMDAHGVEMMLLSLNSPAVQGLSDPAKAAELARRTNDHIAAVVARNPGRFQALAALPMQDPDLAITELERAVRQLGFKGALVNGFSQAVEPGKALYYDLPRYRPFWAAVERLDVPFYLHPRNSLPPLPLYEGHPWLLGASWGFGNETAVHALRLMGCGLFDAHPRLQVVIGHMGENLPFGMWRIDNCNAWAELGNRPAAKRKMAAYFQENFYVSTSGNFRTQALLNTIQEIGADRILFAIDWPFENVDHGAQWFDKVEISEADRRKIGRDNAARLFKLAVP